MNPLAFMRELYGKIIAAAGKLPPLLLFAILTAITLIVAVVVTTLLKVDLNSNVFWLMAIVLVGALIGTFVYSSEGRRIHPHRQAAPHDSRLTESSMTARSHLMWGLTLR